MSRAATALSLACWILIGTARVASADFDVKVKEVSSPSGLYALQVKVTDTSDPQNPKAVANAWVRVQPGDDSGPVLVKTDKDGFGLTTPSKVKDPSPPTSGTIVDCKTAMNGNGGALHYNAATGLLAYDNSTVGQVFYTDMTSTTVNTAFETIIGARVEILGMHFNGFGPTGLALFGDATLRVVDAQGVFFTASYKDVQVGTGFDTPNSLLVGTLGDFSFNTARVSRYEDELRNELPLIPHPTFYLTTAGNLASLTNNFATPGAGGQDATVAVTTAPLGGGRLVPEPSSLALLAVGFAGLLGALGRRQGDRTRRTG